jgi:integrase
MSIYRRGRSWYFDFVHAGERFSGCIGPVSKTAAKEELARKKTAVIEGKLNPGRIKRSPLFKDFAEDFKKNKESEIRQSSLTRIEFSLKPLTEKFGLKRLNDISSFEIEKYRKERKDAGKADATINRELQALKHLFNKAIAWGKAHENPVTKVKLRKEENSRLRFLSEDEENALIMACAPSLRAVVLAALNTGFRRSELLSLTWQDVDVVRGNMTVQAAYAKNGERRSIPMNEELRNVLESLKTMRGASERVFLNGNGEPYKLISTVFDEAVARAKITDFHFHDLRHTFASRLIMAGVDLRSVQVLMGHKTINMTLRYAHLSPDHLRGAVETLKFGKKSHQFSQHPNVAAKANAS